MHTIPMAIVASCRAVLLWRRAAEDAPTRGELDAHRMTCASSREPRRTPYSLPRDTGDLLGRWRSAQQERSVNATGSSARTVTPRRASSRRGRAETTGQRRRPVASSNHNPRLSTWQEIAPSATVVRRDASSMPSRQSTLRRKTSILAGEPGSLVLRRKPRVLGGEPDQYYCGVVPPKMLQRAENSMPIV